MLNLLDSTPDTVMLSDITTDQSLWDVENASDTLLFVGIIACHLNRATCPLGYDCPGNGDCFDCTGH